MDEAEKTARKVCEDHLQAQIRYNREHKILPSEIAVAERMLANGGALQRFYGEIYPALNHDGMTWKHALHCALYVGAFWSSDDIAERRAGRKELEQLNQDISRQANALADMLDRRTELYEHSGFGVETHYAIYEVIDAAAASNGHYRGWIREPLLALRRFDLKYWPTLSECIRIIGEEADQAEIAADTSLTEDATRSSRPSKADSVRALLASIEGHRGDRAGDIPVSFELSHGALADLVNVLFEVPADSLVSDEYIKIERHRAKVRAQRSA